MGGRSAETPAMKLKGLVPGNPGLTWLQVSWLLAPRIQAFHSAPLEALGLCTALPWQKKRERQAGLGGSERERGTHALKNKWHQKGTDGETSRGQERGNDLGTEQLFPGSPGPTARLTIG